VRHSFVADAIASFEAAPEMKAITGEMRAFRATQGRDRISPDTCGRMTAGLFAAASQ
jgi:hypothetical protein